MARYDDYTSSATLDSEPVRWDADRFSREREGRRRGPPVAERARQAEDERFEFRLREGDRYGPPARRPERIYEDDHLVRPAGPLVAYDHRRVESPPPRPRLLRRQSSLDTFDRVPTRKLDEYYSREYAPRAAPLPVPSRRRSPRRRREHDYYEEIRIAEPEYYGDDEYRGFLEHERLPRRRAPSRGDGRFRDRLAEEVELEKPYPRKGKTRIPKRLVHTRAIMQLGYPFVEEGDMIILLRALSKEQIDEVITFSREISRQTETRIRRTSPSPSPIRERPRERIVEHVDMDYHSPRSSHDTLLIAPSQHRSHSRRRSHSRHHRDVSETDIVETVTRPRPRSVSYHSPDRRLSSPMRIVDRHDDFVESDRVRTGPLAVVVRPRDEEDLGYDLIRDTEVRDNMGDREKIHEVRRERRGPSARVLRAMMATLT